MSTLREQLEHYDTEYAPSWNPEEDGIISGPILKYAKAHTAYGEAIVCTVDDEEGGPTAVWLTATVLLDQFKRLQPKVGETVGIKYLGKHPEKAYRRYAVLMDREGDHEIDFAVVKPLDGAQAQDAEEVQDTGSDPDPFDFGDEPSPFNHRQGRRQEG